VSQRYQKEGRLTRVEAQAFKRLAGTPIGTQGPVHDRSLLRVFTEATVSRIGLESGLIRALTREVSWSLLR